ncbi:MAG: VOC family protein, partial [Pseudomonadota bacterium]
FLRRAFGGETDTVMRSEDGVLRHATVRIGDSLVMVSKGTEMFEPRPLALHLYVENTDAVYERALNAGAQPLREPSDQFYGSRSAGVEDRWGNHWWVATQIEQVDETELKQRKAEFRESESEELLHPGEARRENDS